MYYSIEMSTNYNSHKPPVDMTVIFSFYPTFTDPIAKADMVCLPRITGSVINPAQCNVLHIQFNIVDV